MRSVVTEMGGLDIVLDDGSHRVSHQRASFEVLFPLLSQNALYVVEDMHTNYWRGACEGGWRRRSTFLEQMKDLIDDLHGWWHTHPQRLVGAHQIIVRHLEKFFSPSRCESDSLTAMGHGRMERASHGADGLFRC